MKKIILKLTFIFTIMIITFLYTIKWLDDINIKLDEGVINTLLINSNNLSDENKVINSMVRLITNSNYVDPVSIILKKYSSNDNVELVTPILQENKDPVVYIYNTHQTEKYQSTLDVNINYSVLDASFLLEEKLKKYNIFSRVETASIKDVLDTNNWSYSNSYRVSRMFLEKAAKENDSLKYFIDLHRDSVNKNISTVFINDKPYARIMFLLGLENDNYKKNQVVIESLENWVNSKYPGLSRGIYKKEGPGVNGIYNQDFSSNCILIEVGGENNTLEEVENTIEVIAEMIYEYIGDFV